MRWKQDFNQLLSLCLVILLLPRPPALHLGHLGPLLPVLLVLHLVHLVQVLHLLLVLLAPHLTVYDLVILAPAFLLLSDAIVTHSDDPAAPWLRILLYLAFILPLIGPLARWTHLQLSVPAMAALLYEIGRLRAKPAGSSGFRFS